MRRISYLKILLAIMAFCLFVGSANAIEMKDIDHLYDSTQIVEAKVFAPKTFEKADGYYSELNAAIAKGKKERVINDLASKFREFAENAIKSSEVTKLALEAYLTPRDNAKKAKAPTLVPDLYNEAESVFKKATMKVEKGDTKGAKKIVDKAVPMFNEAELEGIKTDILGKAATLIAQAEVDGAIKYAPATFDKAKMAYQITVETLTNDRYERDKSLTSAALAEYEALHSSNIAQSVRSLNKNDQAWEKLMLLYEIEMQKVGTELQMDRLPFDRGPIGAADAMVEQVRKFNGELTALKSDQDKISEVMATSIKKMGGLADAGTALEMAKKLESTVMSTVEEKDNLSGKLTENSAKMEDLKSSHDQVSQELHVRQAKEAKIDSARTMINPTEGMVLLNATDDIVIRLFGLSFASGSSDISDAHVDLLAKVKTILELFPEARLMVEGHTDDRGERTTNMRLSEKRAFSVMQYLRSIMSLPADKISAVGYGPDKPIGTNTTKEGRAKNRRIDIIIFQ